MAALLLLLISLCLLRAPRGQLQARSQISPMEAVLAGATVTWSGGTATTNASGIYTLSNVTAGSQSITANKTGFLARSGTVNVTAGATATLNLQLATAGKITVKVVSPERSRGQRSQCVYQGRHYRQYRDWSYKHCRNIYDCLYSSWQLHRHGIEDWAHHADQNSHRYQRGNQHRHVYRFLGD